MTFNNGKTVSVPADTAVWIPHQLYERIVFEVQLPSHVRREFAQQADYPQEAPAPGYPASGPEARPREYGVVESRWAPQPPAGRPHSTVIERGMYQHPYYVPLYPIYYKYEPKPSVVNADDINEMIPGTEMTKGQLNEKVMAQLMKHKMAINGTSSTSGTGQGVGTGVVVGDSTGLGKDGHDSQSKLLMRRQQQENGATLTGAHGGTNGILKKSVTFDRSQADSDLEGQCDPGEFEGRDSGRGSAEDDLGLSDLDLEGMPSDLEGAESGKEDQGTQTCSVGVGPDGKLFYRRRYRKRRSDKRPAWRYWGNDPAPDLMDPMHYGPYRVGPYDEAYVAPPMECRDTKLNSSGGRCYDSQVWYIVIRDSNNDF